jgi:hypothetical protein
MKSTKNAESVREIGDHRIASDVLLAFRIELAGATGLEPAASCLTGQQRRATYWISTVLTARS